MKIFNHIIILFFCVFLSSCRAPTTYTPDLSHDEIKAEEDHQSKMADDIRARGGMPKTWKRQLGMQKQFETVGERIEKAGAKLCVDLNLQENGCYYYFKLSQNEELNSQADGKNVIIFTGMMRFVENDDELAVVMAHEFAHNLMGHVDSQKNNATIGLLIGLVAEAAAASQGINMGGEMGRAGGTLGILTYSADFEKEADYIGMYVMALAGYDITKAPHFWRRMSLADPNGISGSTTHPSNAERFVALQKVISEIEFKRKNKILLLPEFK